jgi:SAM-dependent methyltransferase
MTAEMIDRARANQEKTGAGNVEFRLGEIEHLPVSDASVDVIISNCVINLSPDKQQVFHEAYRVLKPGGRLAVSDIVTDRPLPRTIRENLSAWAGCVSGALDVQDYLAVIRGAGFLDIQVEPVALNPDMVVEVVDQHGEKVNPGEAGEASLLKSIYSARVIAYKPLD